MRLLSADGIIAIHAAVIEESGGLDGIRDAGSIASAVGRMTSGAADREFYPDIIEKSAALLEALVHNHGFIDGNKRTALSSAATVLRRNGLELDYASEDAVTFMLDVANHKLDCSDIARWLREHTRPSNFTE